MHEVQQSFAKFCFSLMKGLTDGQSEVQSTVPKIKREGVKGGNGTLGHKMNCKVSKFQ
jgi:hypothetical protein